MTIPHNPYTPLADVTRGGIIESQHWGALAIVNPTGDLIAHAGDPNLVTFLRSSAKPLQALPLVESGAADHYHLSERELAVACGSHGGAPIHTETVAHMLANIHADHSALLCGQHLPLDPTARDAMVAAGESPTPLNSNCSGKHAGMLTWLTHLGLNTGQPYTDPDHPIQQRILHTIAEMAGLTPEQIIIGIDGCSVPNFAFPLHNAARAFARLLAPETLSPERAAAATRIAAAMGAAPVMVSHEDGFDTRLMRALPGVLSKGGAEAYQALALPPGFRRAGEPALGVALKIADGNSRARAVIVLELLRQLGLTLPPELDDLTRIENVNVRGLVVGEIRPAFTLEFS